MNKIIITVGPTSSGKSDLAIKLAKRFNGEIISCDSRQIYSGMDLGTGKIPGKWFVSLVRGRAQVTQKKNYFYKNIRHHLIDFVNPKRQYSVSLFQRDVKKAIADILKRRKLPILCGGTAQWIDAVVYNQQIPDVKPNLKLRSKLEKLSAPRLYEKLMKLDPTRAASIDRHNKRRLIRALEIVITTRKPVPPTNYKLLPKNYDSLWIGINPPRDILYQKIKTRLTQRLKAGMLKEVAKLHRQGLPWKKLESFGLEYKFCALYLQKKITYDEMFEQLLTAIKKYSKRQMTWWKRNKEIRWISNPSQAEKFIKVFLK